MYLLQHKGYGLIVFHGTHNKEFIENQLDGWPSVLYESIGQENLTLLEYNRLLTSQSFWERLLAHGCEHALTFETDALLLKDTIEPFLKYDYVGAPWAHRHYGVLEVGNSGLCLRNTRKMLELIQYGDNLQSVVPNDLFFSLLCIKYKCKVPTVEEAKVFSVESIFYPDPCGFHKPDLGIFPEGEYKRILSKRHVFPTELSSPWSFFKNTYVISLKEATERRSYMKDTLRKQGIQHTFIDAVDGRTNPYVRRSYRDRGIIDEYKHGEGVLGCLASHRMIWEQILHESDSSTPTWSLIMEDDVKFHPLLTKDILTKYLESIPKNATMIKLGYLGTEPYSSKFIPVNKYWTSFQNTTSFSFICYGIRTDLIPHLLKHTWSTPIDTVRIPHSYGMINIEDIKDLPSDTSFRIYHNRYLKCDEYFHGVVAEQRFKSQIFEVPALPALPASQPLPNILEKKWMVCYPAGGITDIFCVLSDCLSYVEKYGRTLVIDTRRVEWFKESIHDYIEFNHPNIYVGNIDTLYETLNQRSTFPPEIKGDLSTFQAEYKSTQFYYKGSVSTKLDLSKDYKEVVLVYCNCATIRNITILNHIKFKEPILSVYHERIKKLPSSYLGIHVRNTDHASDVPTFLEAHTSKLHSPFFLACDNKMTIDEIKYKYKHAITFSLIPYSTTNAGLHFMKREKEENKRFIVDSYVDMLLLASASDVFFSCPASGYSQLAKQLCTNKQILQNIITRPTGRRPSFHLLIATIGRPSLERQLQSVVHQLQSDDCLTIVFDGRPIQNLPILKEFKCQLQLYSEPQALGHWGHGIRNKYASMLKRCDFVMHGDDDDTYTPNTFEVLRTRCTDMNTLYVAQMNAPKSGGIIPKSKIIQINDIGTPCGIIPFDANKR